jgi:hypothetical protein
MKNIALENFKETIREAIADYMDSEGCTCCQDIDAHEAHTKRLAKLLDAQPIDTNTYDFRKKKAEI